MSESAASKPKLWRTQRGRRVKSTSPQHSRTLSENQLPQVLPPFAVFLAAFLISYELISFRIVLDEGIYLHGAERLLSGQRIYRDFFALTGPGTYWLYAALLKLASNTLAAAHALLGLELSTISVCVYLIVQKSLGKLAGVAAAASLLAILTPFTHRLYVNHRWDSACCALLGVTFLVVPTGRRIWTILAGAFAGGAAIFTPPALLVSLALAIALLVSRGTRRQALWFALAGFCPLLFAAAVLAAQHSLIPLLFVAGWVSKRYSGANSVPYGFVPPESSSATAHVSLLHQLAIYIPAALPLLALAVFAGLLFRRQTVSSSAKILLASALALAASCYPRWAANNLLFAVPLFVCFLFVTVAPLAKPSALRVAYLVLLTVGLGALFWSITGQLPAVPVDSQIGSIPANPNDARNIAFATGVISPGDTLFVYPYQPIWYALTGANNPTRFDFLQPGMMTRDDEAEALEELTAHPPRWVIWHNLPPRTVLAIWPSSDRSALHFQRIEQWIRTQYSQVKPLDAGFRYSIAIFQRIADTEGR